MMYTKLKPFLLLLALSLGTAGANQSVALQASYFQADKTEAIIIELIGTGLHRTSWSTMPGSGNYSLTVVNLTTGLMQAQVTTSSTSSLLYGLVTGNTYRFTVTRANQSVTEDIEISNQ